LSGTAAVAAAARLVNTLGVDEVVFGLLHVGPSPRPQVLVPRHREGWTQEDLSTDGGVVDAIIAESSRWGADLIVMSTNGHDSVWDRVWGSKTEQIVRKCGCPLLMVPARP